MARIPLAAAVGELRQQILLAMAQAQGEELRFRLGPVELELQVQLEASDKIEGGVKAWVLSFGASDSQSTAETHRVKLTLEPETAAGGDIRVKRQKAGRAMPAPMKE